MQNTTIDGGTVFGEPTGSRAVGIKPGGAEVYASPQLDLWQWPGGPTVESRPNSGSAVFAIVGIARPQLEFLQAVRSESIHHSLKVSPCMQRKLSALVNSVA